MKKLSFLFVIAIFIIANACQNNNSKDKVSVFNGINFHLRSGERVVPITDGIKDNYFSKLPNTSPRIPLFRCIVGSNYVVYLGIPYNETLSQISHSDLNAGDSSLLAAQSSDTTCFRTHFVNNEYLSEYAVVYNKNLVYLLAATTSKVIADSLFTIDSLRTRLTEN